MTSIGAYLPVYTYDTENRIKNIDNGVVDFAYDSEGRQIRRTFLGTSTYYLYGLTGLISEFTTTNTGASQASSTDRLRYRLSEQTGTAVLFVSPSGSLVESNRVYPYGEKWMADYGTSNDQKFTTYTRQDDHYTDEVDYAMMRYYFYSHAAFMSPDRLPGNPADPQSWNKYAYAGNDPINFIDPDGLCRINGVDYPDGRPPCPDNTSVTVTTPGPGGSSIGSPPPGACLPIYWDDVYMGTTCGGGPTIGPSIGPQPPAKPAGDQIVTPVQTCVQPTFMQSLLIKATYYAAAKLNYTVGTGLGFSGGIGRGVGVAGGYSRQLVVSPNGQAAFLRTTGGNIPPFGSAFVGPTWGIGAVGDFSSLSRTQ